MITKAKQPDGLWRYACDECETVRVVKFGDLRNPCKCPIQYIEEVPFVDDPRVSLKEPSLARKAVNYTRATARHVAAGSPEATDEQVAERFAVCQVCPLFKPKGGGRGVCTHGSCGCSLKAVGLTGRNKLRWADSECPYTEGGVHRPRWKALPPAPPGK